MTRRGITGFVPVCIALFLAVLCIAAFVSPVAADDGAGTTEPTEVPTEAPVVEQTTAPTQSPTQVPGGEQGQSPPEQTVAGSIEIPTLGPDRGSADSGPTEYRAVRRSYSGPNTRAKPGADVSTTDIGSYAGSDGDAGFGQWRV